jgi:hypothetical protein
MNTKTSLMKNILIIVKNIIQFIIPITEETKKSVGEKILFDCCQKSIRKDYLHKHIQKLSHIAN